MDLKQIESYLKNSKLELEQQLELHRRQHDQQTASQYIREIEQSNRAIEEREKVIDLLQQTINKM